MKTNIVILCLLVFILPSIFGCATVFKGYEDSVKIYNVPNGTRVYTKDSIEIHTTKTLIGVKVQNGSDKYEKKEAQEIHLRSNVDHVLVLKCQGKEKRVHVYPKISTSWFILDALFVFPLGIDSYTGNFNSFDDIDGTMLE